MVKYFINVPLPKAVANINKLMKYIHVSALFLITVLHISCGENQTNILPDTIKPETTGTPTAYIWDIKQDRNGNIWFAADDGVFRYDASLEGKAGQGKSLIKITGSLIAKHFCSIFEDSLGWVWFGSLGAGGYYYDKKSFHLF